MAPKLIVSDWNGTLTRDEDDKAVLKQIAMDELGYCAARPWLWGKAARLARLKGVLEGMARDYHDDPESQAQILRSTYDLFNTEVINGAPMGRIERSIGRYASSAVIRLNNAFHDFFAVSHRPDIY